MNSGKTKKVENLEADLVIIGGGGAGLTAAVAAAEEGTKNIIVLEKRRVLGGNSIRAGGIFACESPIQKREMVIADKDVLFKTFMKWAHWNRVDPRIVRTYINKSGDTIHWLQEKGIDFRLTALYPNQLRVGHIPSEGGGAQLITVLAKNCQDLGVHILPRTSAKKILRGANGNVTGVMAVKEEGEELRIISKSVIIATGGFGGNKELLNKYCPAYYEGMHLHGFVHTGDGLLMAAEIGAAIEGNIPILKEGPTPDCAENLILKFIVTEPFTLWVNQKGERFVDETAGYMPFESGNSILQQPNKISYTLFDNQIRQDMESKNFPTRKGQRKNVQSADTPVLLNELNRQSKKGPVKIADSWEEIADWIGAEPRTLQATVDEYNSFCDQGYDRDFAKEIRYLRPLRTPPYYAVRTVVVFLDTLGGIKVNANMEVMDKQNDIIPGLYAAGVIADGFEPETYCGELTASALGFAINSGRIAGENAAKIK